MSLKARRRQVLLAGLLWAAVGCVSPTGTPTFQPTVAPPATSAPTAPPTSAPTATPSSALTVPPTQAAGTPTVDCINGWIDPDEGSVTRREGLELLAGSMGVDAEHDVVEMRYFIGPDPPWIIEPHYEDVQHWYIKASLASDTQFRGRWLIEKRTETVKGIAAVAPFDSHDFNSPDWSGFVGEGPPTTYPGLPGEWYGIRYDFVTGEGDSGQPGLPAELLGCLTGT